MRSIYVLAVSSLLVNLLTACSQTPAECNADQSISSVKKIVHDSLHDVAMPRSVVPQEADEMANALTFDVTLIRTISHSNQIGASQCAAKLKTALPESYRKMNQIQEQFAEYDIKYDVQLTDDKKSLVVSVENPLFIAKDLIDAAWTAFDEKRNQAKKTAPNQTQAAPTSPNQTTQVLAVTDLTKYVGKNPSEAIHSPQVNASLKALLGSDFVTFERNIDVSSGLEQVGNSYFASGNAANLGSIEEAAFAIDISSGRSYAAILREGKTVQLYGESTADKLPETLRQWVQKRIDG